MWAQTSRSLKAKTIAAYISSLKTLHNLKDLDSSAFDSPKLKLLLRGAENLQIYNDGFSPSRKAMNLPLLKILGHSLAKSQLSPRDRQVFWSICTLAFYGSLRLGEILCQKEFSFHPVDTFLWSDIFWASKDHIILHLRNTKTAKNDFVDSPVSSTCPVSALLKLRSLLQSCYSFSPGIVSVYYQHRRHYGLGKMEVFCIPPLYQTEI